MTLYNQIETTAKQNKDRLAIHFKDLEISYAELMISVNRVVQSCIARGIKKNDRVVIASNNCPEVIYLYLAASRMQFTMVFLYDLSNATGDEINSLLKNACADWCIVDKEHWVHSHLISFDKIKLFLLEEFLENNLHETQTPSEVSLQKDFVLLQAYTSGTTGIPKGVCLSESAVFNQAKNMVSMMQINHHSRVLLTGYLFNTTGLPLSAAALSQGAALIFKNKKIEDLFEEVEQKKISHFMLQPAGLAKAFEDKKLSTRNLEHLKLIAYGAATMPSSLLQRIRKQVSCQWLQGYGLTETCGPITWLQDENHQQKIKSVGKALPGTTLQIHSEGEIVVKGETVMLGYWDPVTKKIVDSQKLMTDGFLTGDLGYLDNEGYLYLKGRKKDVIVTASGFTIYPAELEECIQNYPSVEEVAVIGITKNAVQGEEALAIIKTYSSIHMAHLKKYLLQHLSELKIPRYIVMTTEPLPRNSNGKIMKKKLKEDFMKRKDEWRFFNYL